MTDSHFKRDDIVFEYRSKKMRQRDASRPEGSDLPPSYVPFDVLSQLRGFQSVFGFTREQAAENIKRGTTRGMKCAVYCDVLLVDFDNQEAAANLFERKLKNDKIAFIRAHSGGRSDHFHVALNPIFGVDVPYSLKQWMAENAPGSDLSFYHCNGNFRLFGTRHEKTGRIKVVVGTQAGSRLSIPIVEEPDPWAGLGSIIGEVKDVEAALGNILSLIGCEPSEGNRHQSLWAAVNGILTSEVQDPNGNENVPLGSLIENREGFVQAILYMINYSWKNPKPEADLERLIRDFKK